MKEKHPAESQKRKAAKKKPGAALVAEWEAKLAREGLASEPGEDKAATALREALSVEEGAEGEGRISEETIKQKLQEHFLNRPEHLGKHLGLHKQIAAAVAQELGITDAEVPEDLIDVVGEELTEVERRVREIVDSRAGSAVRFHYDKMNNLIAQQLGGEYADFSPMALQMIITRVLEE